MARVDRSSRHRALVEETLRRPLLHSSLASGFKNLGECQKKKRNQGIPKFRGTRSSRNPVVS